MPVADNDRPPGQGVVLFGGSGFLGPYILERCPEMVSVGRRPPAAGNRHIHVDDLGDLRALNSLEFDKVIFIIGNTDHHNLEKFTLEPGEPSAFDYHVMPFLRAIEQLKHRKLAKFIHFSSILVYDDNKLTMPVSEHAAIDPYKNRYVLSKYLAEEACKFYAQWLPIINCRFCNLYGPTPLGRYDLIHSLARAFTYAGANTVVATFWDAEDASSAAFVEEMYRGIAGGDSIGGGLRSAQLRMAGQHPYRNARQWAGWIAAGDSGREREISAIPKSRRVRCIASTPT